MPQSLPQRSPVYGPSAGRTAVLVIAALLGVLTAAAAALWIHYGTAVFFHTIMSGVATCL